MGLSHLPHPPAHHVVHQSVHIYVHIILHYMGHPPHLHPPLHPPTYAQLPLGLVQLIIILIFIWAACGRMRRTYTYMGTATYTLFPSGSQGSHSPSTEKVARYKKVPAVKF